jgi:hypothetical protein
VYCNSTIWHDGVLDVLVEEFGFLIGLGLSTATCGYECVICTLNWQLYIFSYIIIYILHITFNQ